MPRITLNTLDELQDFVFERSGQAATGDWLPITQDMIDRFGEVTHDPQWIHSDVARAARESPFLGGFPPGTGPTVAHGFLTLSLFSHLMASALQLPPVKAGVNYGCDKLRFVAPVPVNARVRAVVKLLTVEPASAGMLQLRWDLTIEIEGMDRPALAAVWLSRIVP
jgi:acyl dehydratase